MMPTMPHMRARLFSKRGAAGGRAICSPPPAVDMASRQHSVTRWEVPPMARALRLCRLTMRQASEARSRPRVGRAPASGVTAVSERGSLARPFVSIVVPCRNEAEYIEQMLDSMLANEYPRDRLEVLIVDGMSDDGTREVIAE